MSNDSITISLFNNDNAGFGNGTHGPSVALEYKVPLPPSKSATPELLQRLEVPTEPVYALSQGSYSFVPTVENATTQLVGYGQLPLIREYGLEGDLRWEGRSSVPILLL